MIKPTCEDTFLLKKRNLHNNYFSFTFRPYSQIKKCKPGHFIQLQLPETDIFFRRPFSIASVTSDGDIEIIFKIFGKGTALLANLKKGDRVNLLGPLGVPFTFPKKNEQTILIAGGVGFPPLMYLTVEMIAKGYDPKSIHFFYGGRTTDDIIEKKRLKKLGVNFYPATEDGSYGTKALVTKPVEDFIKSSDAKMRIFSCGPTGMLKAADALGLQYNISGQLSLEAPMPCGVGICLGCVKEKTDGTHARVCCDGPIFEIGEIVL